MDKPFEYLCYLPITVKMSVAMIDITYNIQSQPHKDIKVQASIHLNTSFENDNFFEQLHLKSCVAILVHNNCKIGKFKKAINMIDILNIIFNE